MMKSFLISIKPQYVEKILNGEKIYEIRRTIPKEWKEYLRGKTSVKPEPSKWYIYCTNGNRLYDLSKCGVDELEQKVKEKKNKRFILSDLKSNNIIGSSIAFVNRKVVAEFTLNEIEKFDIPYPAYFYEVKDKLKHITDGSCLTLNDLHRYLKNDSGYTLRIDDLKVYDKPKELNEFGTKCEYASEIKCRGCLNNHGEDFCNKMIKPLNRPPQSWMFVESLEEE